MAKEITNFSNLSAKNLSGGAASFTSIAAGTLNCTLKAVSLSKADSYALADAEKVGVILCAMSAASKTLTLGLVDGAAVLFMNSGDTNAITVKNLLGDSGTSVAAGKVALVVASTTANGTTVTALT